MGFQSMILPIVAIWKYVKPTLTLLCPFRRTLLACPKSRKLAADRAEQLVMDLEARDKLLRQDFDEQNIPKDLDAIVIGSGISSLATAVFLARAGKKVVVLEQYSSAGGNMGTLKLHGQEFNIGLYLVLNQCFTKYVQAKDILGEITSWALELAELPKDVLLVGTNPPSSGWHSKDDEMTVHGGTAEESIDHLCHRFPEDKAAIRQFASTCNKIWSQIKWTFCLAKFLPIWVVNILGKLGFGHWVTDLQHWRNMRLVEYVKSLTDNVALQRALVSPILYTLPDADGFPMSCTAWVHTKFDEGFYYPVGGPEMIPFHMTRQIRDLGGQVMVNAAVTSILTDKNGEKAIGVRVRRRNMAKIADNKRESAGGAIDIFAPTVVSGVGMWNTYKNLLSWDIVKKYPLMKTALDQNKPPSHSAAFAGFVSLRGTAEELQVQHSRDHVFVCQRLEDLRDGWSLPLDSFLNSASVCGKGPRADSLKGLPGLYTDFPSARDPSYNHKYPGRTSCCLFLGIPADWFSKWDGMDMEDVDHDEEHNKLEKAIGDRMTRFLLSTYPQLEGKIHAETYLSPIRLSSVLGCYKGKIMGLELNAERSTFMSQATMRPSVGLEGLFMTGQDLIGPGAHSAALSGIWAASEVLERNIYLEMELRARSPGWLRRILKL